VWSPKHWSLPAGNIQVLHRAQNSLTGSEIVKTLKECASCSHYLLNKYFVVFSVAVFCCLGSNIEQLNFVDAWKGHTSFVFMMCYWTDTYTAHCPSSCVTVAQHFGNSLQNMFYRQCPVFSMWVSYATLCIFDLNVWSHLWSLTANQKCRTCGVEKHNWYTMN